MINSNDLKNSKQNKISSHMILGEDFYNLITYILIVNLHYYIL